MNRITRRQTVQGLLATLAVPGLSWAQSTPSTPNYPTKPIRLLVGYSAGGAVDIVARSIGQGLSSSLGQSVIVENKPGAGTNIAIRTVIDAPADGYTLLMTANALAANMALYKPMPFDAERDLAPVSLVGRVPVVIAANPGVPYASIAQLIAAAKARPGSIAYATPGNGSTPHIAVEMFAHAAGIHLQHIPYRGGTQAITDTLGGQVPLVAVNALEVLPHAKSGKLKVIATLGAQRTAIFPEAPTIAESGFAGFEASVWYGVMAPAATPKPVIEKLHDEVQKVLQTPQMRERMSAVGGDVAPASTAQFAALIHAERERYAKIIRDANIHLD